MDTIRNYKCISCGAGLRFDPNTQNWKCDYCRSQYTKQQLDEYYAQLEARKKARQEQVAAQTGRPATDEPKQVMELDSYHCKNCGAEIVADKEAIATFCLYCKSPTIIKARMQGEFDPKYVIPFQLDQKQAVEYYTKWIKQHFLAPKSFKKHEEIEKIRGVYAPFWLYHSSGAQVSISGVGEKTRTWRSGDVEYTETSYFNVRREGEISYQNVPVDSSSKMDDESMEAIEPFDYKSMVAFAPEYMTGFFAERYDEGKSELQEKAVRRMRNYALNKFRETIHYSRFTPRTEQVNFKAVEGDYALLPVYILTNIYEGKTLQYIVNGQTGKIYGEVPVSKGRLASVFGVAFLIIWMLLAYFW